MAGFKRRPGRPPTRTKGYVRIEAEVPPEVASAIYAAAKRSWGARKEFYGRLMALGLKSKETVEKVLR